MSERQDESEQDLEDKHKEDDHLINCEDFWRVILYGGEKVRDKSLEWFRFLESVKLWKLSIATQKFIVSCRDDRWRTNLGSLLVINVFLLVQ